MQSFEQVIRRTHRGLDDTVEMSELRTKKIMTFTHRPSEWKPCGPAEGTANIVKASIRYLSKNNDFRVVELIITRPTDETGREHHFHGRKLGTLRDAIDFEPALRKS